MSHQPSSFGSKMSSFFRSLNCCGGSVDEDEPRAIQIVSAHQSYSLNSKPKPNTQYLKELTILHLKVRPSQLPPRRHLHARPLTRTTARNPRKSPRRRRQNVAQPTAPRLLAFDAIRRASTAYLRAIRDAASGTRADVERRPQSKSQAVSCCHCYCCWRRSGQTRQFWP
jgi:hypothetical protein